MKVDLSQYNKCLNRVYTSYEFKVRYIDNLILNHSNLNLDGMVLLSEITDEFNIFKLKVLICLRSIFNDNILLVNYPIDDFRCILDPCRCLDKDYPLSILDIFYCVTCKIFYLSKFYAYTHCSKCHIDNKQITL